MLSEKSYWARKATRRRTLIGAGVVGSLALIGCGGSKKSTTGAGSGGGASPSGAGGASGTSGSGTYTQPTSGWDKFTPEQFRTYYDGDNFKNLEGHKQGPKYGGVLRVPGSTPASWDPTGAVSGSVIATAAFFHNQLLQVWTSDFVPTTHEPQVAPVLAQAMPEQPDPLTYIFKLHQGVKFHDVPPVSGRELTAEDVAYTFNTYKKTTIQQDSLAAVDSIQAVDKYTVSFKLKEPAAYLLAAMSAPTYWVFAREQHQSADGLAKHPIGTGAWLFQGAQPLQGYQLKKNPNYFRKDPRTGMQLPYLEGFETIRYANAAAQTAAFRAGEVDQYYPPDFKTWVTVMQSNPESITQVVEGPAIAQYHIAMRLDKPPFNDVRIRQALSQLIDREALIKNLFSGMAAYTYPQDWSYWGYKWGWKADQLGKNAEYDPANAKKLLAAAGWDSKFVIEMYFGTSTSGTGFNIYQAVSGMWEAAGIKTNITTTADPAASNKVIVERSYPGTMPYFVFPPGIDPDNYTYLTMHSKAPQNIYYINDSKIDEWCIAQRRALQKPDRLKILTDLMNYDLEQTTRISLVNPYKINLRKPNLYNITDNIDYWSVFGWGPISVDLAWKSS